MNSHNSTAASYPGAWCLEPNRLLPEIHPNTMRWRLYLRLRSTTTEATGSFMVVLTALCVAAALLSTGCSGAAASNPVDAPRARAALKTALDTWKQGTPPKSLQSASTPITVQDFDWMGGLTLVDFQILGDGEAHDANLSVPVQLTLSGGPTKKKSHAKSVHYLVGTSPATTVFRDVFKP